MRVSWPWLIAALVLGSIAGYVVGTWLLSHYGTAAMWMTASALTILASAIAILHLVWQQEA